MSQVIYHVMTKLHPEPKHDFMRLENKYQLTKSWNKGQYVQRLKEQKIMGSSHEVNEQASMTKARQTTLVPICERGVGLSEVISPINLDGRG